MSLVTAFLVRILVKSLVVKVVKAHLKPGHRKYYDYIAVAGWWEIIL